MSTSSVLIKGAICGALLFGNVVPPQNSYIEDDSDFNSVTNFLVDGWGWFQFNSAKAACDVLGNTEGCSGGYGPRDPFPADPLYPLDPDEPLYPEDPPTPPPPLEETREECLTRVEQKYSTCQDFVNQIAVEERLVCLAMPVGSFMATACSVGVEFDLGQDLNDCYTTFIADKAACPAN